MATEKETGVVLNNPDQVFDELRAACIEDLRARAKRIADACNQASSWGGYSSEVSTTGSRPRARVWSYGAHDDEARQQRLVKNLDAGR